MFSANRRDIHVSRQRQRREYSALGFGTFRIPEDDVRRILPEALKLGFRHVDTAQIYKNEGAVGEVIAQSGISRHDIFLTTKVWWTVTATMIS